MPTTSLLDPQESLARAINAETEYEKERPKTLPTLHAFPKDINYTQDRHGIPYRTYEKTQDRRGMPYRTYDKSRRNFKDKDGKNPIRNDMCLLCRLCHSDSHLLRECPKLSPSERVQLAKRVYAVDSLASDSDECSWALDEIQDFSDPECEKCVPIIESESSANVNNINFTCLADESMQLIPENSDRSFYEHLADRAFLHDVAPRMPEEDAKNVLFTRRKNPGLNGICMDDAAEKTVAGIENYKKYCIHTNTPVDLAPSNERLKLGAGIHESLGRAIIRFPIDNEGNYFEYETDVINTDTPVLVWAR